MKKNTLGVMEIGHPTQAQLADELPHRQTSWLQALIGRAELCQNEVLNPIFINFNNKMLYSHCIFKI